MVFDTRRYPWIQKRLGFRWWWWWWWCVIAHVRIPPSFVLASKPPRSCVRIERERKSASGDTKLNDHPRPDSFLLIDTLSSKQRTKITLVQWKMTNCCPFIIYDVVKKRRNVKYLPQVCDRKFINWYCFIDKKKINCTSRYRKREIDFIFNLNCNESHKQLGNLKKK